MKDGNRSSGLLSVMATLVMSVTLALTTTAGSADERSEARVNAVDIDKDPDAKETPEMKATTTTTPTPIIWHDHDTGKATAAKTGRPLLIHFTADWCHWCKVMQRDTYAHPEVMVLLRDAFVTARIDADRQRRLRAEYGVQGLPTVWFLTASGEPITYLPGYIDGPTFLQVLRCIASGAYQNQSFAAFQAAGN